MDSFTVAYLECAIWADADLLETSRAYSWADFSQGARDQALKDCIAFQDDMADDLESAGISFAEAGRLFWLTRNGHGVGFWSDESIPEPARSRLNTYADRYGEAHVYLNDDGNLEIFTG